MGGDRAPMNRGAAVLTPMRAVKTNRLALACSAGGERQGEYKQPAKPVEALDGILLDGEFDSPPSPPGKREASPIGEAFSMPAAVSEVAPYLHNMPRWFFNASPITSGGWQGLDSPLQRSAADRAA
jgi:hypothetical protein